MMACRQRAVMQQALEQQVLGRLVRGSTQHLALGCSRTAPVRPVAQIPVVGTKTNMTKAVLPAVLLMTRMFSMKNGR